MEFTSDATALLIWVTDQEREDLLAQRDADPDEFRSDRNLCEQLEPIIANSELDWVDPSETGDLTDAPMLGVFGSDLAATTEPQGPYGGHYIGRWGGKDRYVQILRRWAFRDYQVRSPLDDLADYGYTRFSFNPHALRGA